jgi:hypothetical protein
MPRDQTIPATAIDAPTRRFVMLTLAGWDVGMSTLAAFLLVGGAVIVGIATYFIGEVRVGYEGITTGLAALVGGYLGSEAFGSVSTWGWEIEGLFVFPAVLGAFVLAVVVDFVVRRAKPGAYLGVAQRL